MTHIVAALRPTETIEFDHVRLAALCDEMGADAEAHIAERLAEVEMLIETVSQRDPDDVDGMAIDCIRLGATAQEIGMKTVSRAAWGLRESLICDDRIARDACLRRLVRLNEPRDGGWTMMSGETASRQPDTVA